MAHVGAPLTIGADGIPVATRADDGTKVPFHFLHFQGSAKDLMAKFAWCTMRKLGPRDFLKN